MRGGPMSHPDENSNTNPVTSQSGKAPEPQTPDAPGQQQAKNSSSSQPDTPDRRTAGRSVGMRSRLLPLVLTALMVLSAILTDPAAAGASRGSEPTAGRPPLNRALARLVLSPAQASIRSGASQAYTATGYDAAGHELGDATTQTSFSINQDGSCTEATCTATKLGRHTVTGTVDLGNETISGTAAVQVVPRHRRMGRPQPLARLELSPSTATIQAGEHRDYTAEGYDAAGHDLGDYTAYTSFSIDLPGACTGTTCTATRTGDYTVTGTVTGTKVTGTAILHVGAGPLATLELQPGEATIGVGATQAYIARGFDADHHR